MINVRVVDEACSVDVTLEQNDWNTLIAALAADPENIQELRTALTRFQGSKTDWDPLGDLTSIPPDSENSDRFAIVDLPARIVAFDGRISAPASTGYVEVAYNRDTGPGTVAVTYQLADDWLLAPTLSGWQKISQERKERRRESMAVDVRQVLYDGVLEFLLTHWDDQAFAGSADRSARLHEAWLTTPQADLAGLTPRDVLLRDHQRLESDLESRARQWSFFGTCPVGIEPCSAAYRSGSFGRHEIIMYYDMVRHLLELIAEIRAISPRRPRQVELGLLTELRLSWMNLAQEELGGRAPQEVIDLERRRIPPVATEAEACIDPECPLCRMMADSSFGPTFWFLDGCHLDDEFAFSFCRTREEWLEEQSRYGRSEQCSEDQSPSSATPASSQSSGIWQFSHVNEELILDIPLPQRTQLILFGIGGHLAELAENVRSDYESSHRVRELLSRFENLRAAIRDRNEQLGQSLLQQCCDDLAALSGSRPDLADKCHDLSRKFRWLDEGVVFSPTGGYALRD